MLFSNEKVAATISENFEPVWVSVRPVPRVTIDFGNGKVIKRTLHGNVATLVCEPSGDIVDILPGVYEADTYLERLLELKWLHEIYKTDATALRRYHTRRSKQATDRPTGDTSRNNGPNVASEINVKHVAASSSLVRDTEINEGPRRQMIHAYLKDHDHTKPSDVTKWLYREVLHADLDDPFMGLGETLFGRYPFADEDAIAR